MFLLMLCFTYFVLKIHDSIDRISQPCNDAKYKLQQVRLSFATLPHVQCSWNHEIAAICLL